MVLVWGFYGQGGDIARILCRHQPWLPITPPQGLRRLSRSCLLASNAYVLSLYGADLAPDPKKEGIPMALNICWLDDLAKANDHARQTKKPILLDFFNPQ